MDRFGDHSFVTMPPLETRSVVTEYPNIERFPADESFVIIAAEGL
jgi:hypothetical protein